MRILRRDETGSIPLALLAIIMSSGIVVSLGAVMVQQNKQVRFDRDYTQAVQVADGGIQDAIFRANNLLDPSECTPAAPCTSVDATGDGYSWTATKVMQGASLIGYDVVSTGTEAGRSRSIRVQIAKIPRFPLAAFGDKGVELKGSNGADSYNSATGANKTGNGQIGSNGNVNFNGASTTVDKVALYNHDATPANVCHVNGNSNACDNVTEIGPKLDLASPTNMLFIDDQIASCEATRPDGVLPTWKASEHSGVFNGLGGGAQCFSNVVFDVNTTVVNPPAVIFVKQGVTFERQKSINCPGCSSGSRPLAANLQIFSAGTQDLNNTSNDTETVAIGNQSYIGGAIYAPRAACLGNPSAAQADVYGALICGSIGRITSGNQGGWAFHYDDALGNLGTGGYAVTRIDELD